MSIPVYRMMTKIGLFSDVHATAAPVEEALTLFRRQGVDMVFCLGDIAGYGDELDETVGCLLKSRCEAISGNHDIWFMESAVPARQQWIQEYFSSLPVTREFTIEGARLYAVHASPPCSNMQGIKLLDKDGEIIPASRDFWTGYLAEFNYDLLLVGHTHQVFSEKLGDTLVINPGSTRFNHTCAILTLPLQTVQFYPLSNREPRKVWNWGQMGSGIDGVSVD